MRFFQNYLKLLNLISVPTEILTDRTETRQGSLLKVVKIAFLPQFLNLELEQAQGMNTQDFKGEGGGGGGMGNFEEVYFTKTELFGILGGRVSFREACIS